MVTLKPINLETVASFRAVRLAALRDAPSAFGSTYAKESELSDADWDRRVAQWHGGRSVCYLAWDGDRPCGIVAALLDRDDVALAHLASMWVAPTHRRHGVGRLLVDGVVDWARGKRVGTLSLAVTSNNDVATRFYERTGFTRTGTVRPYRNDPALAEVEMARPVDVAGATSARPPVTTAGPWTK